MIQTGLHDPLMKIYVTAKKLDHFPLAMFLFSLSQVCISTMGSSRVISVAAESAGV